MLINNDTITKGTKTRIHIMANCHGQRPQINMIAKCDAFVTLGEKDVPTKTQCDQWE